MSSENSGPAEKASRSELAIVPEIRSGLHHLPAGDGLGGRAPSCQDGLGPTEHPPGSDADRLEHRPRAAVRGPSPERNGQVPAVGPAPVPEPRDPEKEARLAAMDKHLAGLALSGGGIRSATFALGVLQGLADLKILSRFDYLSTVSGGGYIGGWLAAWIKREGNPLSVERQLSPSRITQSETDRDVIGRDRIVDEEPEPVHHLRSYSNYLTPRPGLLSVDTWTVLTIYVRNALINLLLLLPLTVGLVLIGRGVVLFYTTIDASEAQRTGVFLAFCGLLSVAILSLGLHVSYLLSTKVRATDRSKPTSGRKWMRATLVWTIIVPLVAAAALACWSFSIEPRKYATLTGGGTLDESSFKIRIPRPIPEVVAALPGPGESGPRAWGDWLADGLRRINPWFHSQIQGLQPNSSTAPFFSMGLDQEAEVFGAWYKKGGLLWISAIEYGLIFGCLAVLVHIGGYLFFLLRGLDPDTIGRDRGEERNRLRGFATMSSAAFMAGFTGGFLFLTMSSQVLWRLHDQPYAIVTVGPPLALLVFVAATFVEIWLLGRWQSDDLREWWARSAPGW